MATKGTQDEGGKRRAREKVGDGIRQGIGVLSAFKDAIEETINEARERGDLSSERAKEVMKGALGRAQAAASEARERLDFVHQKELEPVQDAVAELRRRVDALEAEVFGSREEERRGP
jgi:polyhydroxyalkanoate synthesis regulator phasin